MSAAPADAPSSGLPHAATPVHSSASGGADRRMAFGGILFRVTLCTMLSLPCAAHSCNPNLDGGTAIESSRYSISYRPDPARVAVGKPFAIDLVVCPKDGTTTVDELRVDAHMPEHRHGMNYKASVKPQGEAGRYRAEGLMFHMPGRWELLFDVRDAKGIERLKRDHPLQ